MSRVAPKTHIEQDDLNELFKNAESFMGFLPNDGLIMAHKPDVLTTFFELAKAIYAEGKIDSGLKRMIGYISSAASGCLYCSAHTMYGAGKQGVSKEKLEQLWEFKTSSLFSEAEKAALNLALKASMIPNNAQDEDFDILKTYFDDEGIVEIVGVISMFGFLNRWNSTLNTQIEDAPNSFYKSVNKK